MSANTAVLRLNLLYLIITKMQSHLLFCKLLGEIQIVSIGIHAIVKSLWGQKILPCTFCDRLKSSCSSCWKLLLLKVTSVWALLHCNCIVKKTIPAKLWRNSANVKKISEYNVENLTSVACSPCARIFVEHYSFSQMSATFSTSLSDSHLSLWSQ